MPKWAYILPMLLCVLLLLIAFYGGMTTAYPAGILQIGDIQAEIYTTHAPTCECCAPLWSGGIATIEADLSSVQAGDWANLTLLDGTRLVLECTTIIPCIRAGPWLITLQGIFQAEGDIIIYDKCMAWWLVKL